MKIENETINSRLKEFEITLKKNEIKLTHQRMEIYKIVASTTSHPDASSVYKRIKKKIPSISLDTVYRTLWLLRDLKLLNIVGSELDSCRFDANVEEHHHFVCKYCGKIIDFHVNNFSDLEIPYYLKDEGEIHSKYLELRGICNECLKKQ